MSFSPSLVSGKPRAFAAVCTKPSASFETEGGYDFVYVDGQDYHVRHTEPHPQHSILTT